MVSLSESLHHALQNHAGRELQAYLLYVQAHHWLEVRHFDGFAEKVKSFGEKRREWQNKLLDYVTLRGNAVSVIAAPLPAVNWETEVGVYEYFLALEESYYAHLKELFAQAREAHDFDVETLLSGILEEQVVRADDWEGEVTRIRGYSKTAGLVWLYNDR